MSRTLWLLAVLGLSASCSDPPPPNVILISLDTLRPDRLGSYGYDRPTSPALDKLATGGLVFEDVTSVSPWTLPSHASLFTSLYPSQHGAKDDQTRLGDGPPTLAEVFHRSAYDTAAIVNAHYLTRRYGLLRGFEDREYVSEWEDPNADPPRQKKSAAQIVDLALEWIRAREERPFFLFLHFYDAHSDYAPDERSRELLVRPYTGLVDGSTQQLYRWRREGRPLSAADVRYLSDLYDAQIRQLDAQLGRLYEALDRLDHRDDTVVLVTSDHGEELYEHGSLLHGRTYFQEVIAIPWLLRGPGVPAGRRVSTPLSLIDIPATLVDLVGLRVPASWQGRSALPLWQNDDVSIEPRVLFAEADHGDGEPDRRRLVRWDRYKLIHDRTSGSSSLFDLSRDRDEAHDRITEDLPVLPALRAELERFLSQEAKGEPLGELDEQTRRLLEQLGYTR